MSGIALERLIKSLSRGELKAFSSSMKKESDTVYFKLFKDIKKKGIANLKSSVHNRKYLYDSILESLSKTTSNIDTIILKKLLNTEILFNKQLIKESWKEVNKVQKLAEKYERFGFFIQILEWKKTIGFYKTDFTRQDYIELSTLEEKVINQQAIYLQTKNLYMEILGLKKEIGYLPLHYDKTFFSKFKVQIAPDVNSNRSEFYSQITQAIYHWMLKEHNKEYKLTKEVVENIEIKIDPTEYLIGSLEHLTSCVCNASFNELLSTLNILKNNYYKGYFGINTNIELRLFYYAANYEIMSYTFQGNSKMLILKIKEVEEDIEYWGKKLSKEMLIVTYSALKIGHYLLGNTKEAMSYVNKMLNESNKSIRKDAFIDALLFNILMSFDKHDFDYKENTLIKTIRYLKKNDMMQSFEYEFSIILLKHLPDSDIFNKVYNDMQVVFEKHFYKLEDGRLYSENYLPVYIWLLSKNKKKPVMDIMESWYNNKL